MGDRGGQVNREEVAGERQDHTVKNLIGHRKKFHFYSNLSVNPWKVD